MRLRKSDERCRNVTQHGFMEKKKKRSLQAVVTFLEEKQVSLKKAISLAFHRVLDLVVLVKEFE